MTLTLEELADILHQHAQWLKNPVTGRKAVLRREDLHDADFEHADLRHAIFRYCDFSSANFRGARLQYADFIGSNMTGATFAQADIHRTIFAGANLRGARFGNNKVIQIGPIGSRKDMLVVKKFENGATEVMTGCFRGTLDDLADAVNRTHRNHSQYLQEYQAAIIYCRTIWEATK